jgi:hypothetical protein
MWHVWCVAVPSFLNSSCWCWIVLLLLQKRSQKFKISQLLFYPICVQCLSPEWWRRRWSKAQSLLADGWVADTHVATRCMRCFCVAALFSFCCSCTGIFLFRVGFAMHSVHDLHHCECYLRMAIMAWRKACTDLWRKNWSARMKCTIANICYRSWVKSVLEILGFAVAANSSLPWQASYKFHHWVYTSINQQSALFDQSSSGNILSQCNQ